MRVSPLCRVASAFRVSKPIPFKTAQAAIFGRGFSAGCGDVGADPFNVSNQVRIHTAFLLLNVASRIVLVA